MVLRAKLEITCIRTQSARRSYYFCVGKPSYKDPLAQEKELGSCREQLPRKTPSRRLMMMVKDAAKRVLDARLADRVQPDPPEALNEEQIGYVAETIHSAIAYAAALDLDRRPRLSRTNAGKC